MLTIDVCNSNSGSHRGLRLRSTSCIAALLALAVSGCGSDPGAAAGFEDEAATGRIEAALARVPAGVLCVSLTASTSSAPTRLNVSKSQSSASISIGRLPAGPTIIDAAAYAVACDALTSSSRPDWIGEPVTVEVVPGVDAQVSLTLVPVVPTTVSVDFLTPATSLAAGYYTSFALGTTGLARAWGYNEFGQLGDGTTAGRLSPWTLGALGAVSSVSGGWGHSCAVTRAGGLTCWGRNVQGQLGDGTTASRLTPVQVMASGVAAADLGSSRTCVLKTDASVWCAGTINGDGDDASFTSSFTRLASGVEQVSAGDDFTCVRASGSVRCWGENAFGQLGRGTTNPGDPNLELVRGLNGVAEVSAGGYHACARKYDGTVWCWGLNAMGQLGDGSFVNRSLPVRVTGITSAVELAAGGFSSCARLEDHSVFCWGDNSQGQLGDGTGNSSSTPVSVRRLTGAEEIVAGGGHACARLGSGAVQCWGNNQFGQIGDGTSNVRFVPTNPAW